MIERLPPQHPERVALANELHARPFPMLTAPARAVHLALMAPDNPAERDPEADRAHLADLIDRFGGQHPAPGADHYSGKLGRVWLKWERHTEFVTYTLFGEGVAATPFDGTTAALFPTDWLAAAPGQVVAATLVRIEPAADEAEAEGAMLGRLAPYFDGESLAVAHLSDRTVLAGGDFRLHEDGMSRFAVMVQPGIGGQRLGRIVQRLLEIETYKSVSMLTLPVARKISRRLAEIDRALAALNHDIAKEASDDRATLDKLTRLSAEIESMASDSAFRFGAAGAYAAIVRQRIEVLREQRLYGHQTFGEFMARRYNPAMRTCQSAEQRLAELSNRAARIADLLRTRVDVAMADQNRALLESMDRRAALQLRLQETVEGLSVVAISYYAVSLVAYALAPLAQWAGVDKSVVLALAIAPVLAVVWWMVRRIRKRVGAE
jgi:uncharacterized membrane-anchored protein